MTKYFSVFSLSALTTMILCAPSLAGATKYRAGPGANCKVLEFPSVLSSAWNCAVPTGSEFLSADINGAELDINSPTSTQTEVQTCGQAWNASTLTCSSYTSATASGVQHLYPAYTPFTGGTAYDYRYYHIESNGTNVLGVYTTTSDT